MKRAPRHLHQPRPDRPDLWSQRWTTIAGICLAASFFTFFLGFFKFPTFTPFWAWSDGWPGAWVHADPTSYRAKRDLYPPVSWRALVPWLMAIPVMLIAGLPTVLRRGRLLLSLVLGYLLAVCVPFFGLIELPLGGHDGDGWLIILTGWGLVLGSACIAAGAHIARRHPDVRRGWWLAGAGGVAMLGLLLLPIGGEPWVQTAMAHPERRFTGFATHNGVVDPVFWRVANGPTTWTMQRQVLGGWVIAYGALGMLMLFVRRRWATTCVRWAGALFLLAYPISGIIAYRLAPLYVVTGSLGSREGLGSWSLCWGSAANGLMAAGQFILAAVAIGTVAEAGLIPRAHVARQVGDADEPRERTQVSRQAE